MTDEILVGSTDEQLPSWVTGNLDDVIEQKDLLPPSSDVLAKIESCEAVKVDKDNNPRNWRWLSAKIILVDGIEVNGDTKFKGKSIFLPMICYHANYKFYANHTEEKKNKYANDQLKTGQHLIDLKKLCKATGINGVQIESINGISDDVADSIAKEVIGKKITLNVGQFTSKKTGITENTFSNFKAVADEDLV